MVILDLETSIDFNEALTKTNNKFLNVPVIATHPWLAVTEDEGLVHIWEHTQAKELLHYLAQNKVCGWNILEFDLVVIQLTAILQGGIWERLEVIDLFDLARIKTKRNVTPSGVWYKLEEVAQLNLGYGKLTNSALIPGLFFEDKELVIQHCKRDVEIERQLYELASSCGLEFPEKKDHLNVITQSWRMRIE